MDKIFWSLRDNVAANLAQARADWLKACETTDPAERIALLESVRSNVDILDDVADEIVDAEYVLNKEAEHE